VGTAIRTMGPDTVLNAIPLQVREIYWLVLLCRWADKFCLHCNIFIYIRHIWIKPEPPGLHPKRGKALDVNWEPALQIAIDCLGSRTPNP
jgi:hypothetical protein